MTIVLRATLKMPELCLKLIDTFGIIHQFQMILIHMESTDDIYQLVGFLNILVQESQGRGHNLVDLRHNRPVFQQLWHWASGWC